jgi:hypothetical protein
LIVSVVRAVLTPGNACVCSPEGSIGQQLVTINGARAVLTAHPVTGEASSVVTIRWPYSPSALIFLSVSDVSVDDALKAARQLSPPDPTVWASLECTTFSESETFSSYDPSFAGHPCSAPTEVPLG